ncbi:MAG: hemerythrin domain-containing protein [Aeromonadaceae bacterium]|nr:hemerythrin domain-containing protein [Aeromonadaceae bacterium]
MLDALHQEHLNIARLLDILRQKLFAIRSEQPVRYGLMRDVLCYLSEVADQQHHPREDLIYDYYLKYRCDDLQLKERLKVEHKAVAAAGKELREMVDMILMDAVIPLEQLVSKLEAFIVLQQSHMDFEEGELFPDLRQALTEDDWRNLEQQWQYRISDDPLFGREVAERYQDLFNRLRLANA